MKSSQFRLSGPRRLASRVSGRCPLLLRRASLFLYLFLSLVHFNGLLGHGLLEFLLLLLFVLWLVGSGWSLHIFWRRSQRLGLWRLLGEMRVLGQDEFVPSVLLGEFHYLIWRWLFEQVRELLHVGLGVLNRWEQ